MAYSLSSDKNFGRIRIAIYGLHIAGVVIALLFLTSRFFGPSVLDCGWPANLCFHIGNLICLLV